MKITQQILVSLLLIFAYTNIVFSQQNVEQWGRFEISFSSQCKKNAFEDVKLTATFVGKDTTFNVSGFYDGDNNFKIRFMPPTTGAWKYKTKSNIAQLNNKKGTFECVRATGTNHGFVKVSDTHNFKYADGTQYYPFGTTAYAWTHMGNELQEMTLNSLKKSGFNKVRMCVFPKDYNLVKEEPEIYPFELKELAKDSKGNKKYVWNFDKFNPAFFQHLEKRIDELDKLGIEADLILFHPYDKGRWGFDSMPSEVNIRYIKYIIARLGSFRNVWWSMANEYDYVKAKTDADWELLSKTVYENDSYRHLCSIHGSTAKYYKYWEKWFTHLSIQDEGPVADFGRAAILRNAFDKPIVFDEVCYEGNLTSRWGRYSPEEMTHVIWQGVIAGTYVTHGEAYMFKDATDTIFWAKGGKFKGESWKRVAFLRSILETAPGPIELADVSRDNYTSTNGKGYYLIYFGKEIHDSWLFNLPRKVSYTENLSPGKKYKVDIIDTWDMTITPYPGVFETAKPNDYRLYDKDFQKIRLPEKAYMALRIQEIK
ncbi:MAG: DUF5060 domain-containing protein [Paludibacter sp.]|nr:DUF5060 domain-containing protein [Paludibacter sp.]